MLHERPQMFNGHKVQIIDPVHTEMKTKRTWKERLFSLPFRPFCKFKTVISLVDVLGDGRVVKNGLTISMNPATWAKLKSKSFPS